MTASTANPKVSIIMPTHNRAGFILETISSIRKQTFKNWELIIIDDGSDDGTEDMVRRVEDERILFFKQDRTGIGGKNKNTGIRHSSGELIAFIDSDDLWGETKLEKQLAALQQYPEAGFCLTGGYNFYTPHEPVEFFYKQREGVRVDQVFTDYFRSALPVFTQALMMRRSCLEKTGPFREKKSFSDLDFMLELAYNFKAVILYEPLVYRRLHENSYSSGNWEKSYYEGIDVIHSCKERKMVDEKLVSESLFRLYINFGEDCLQHGERKKAIGQFMNAWKNRPASIVPLKKSIKTILNLKKLIPIDPDH